MMSFRNIPSTGYGDNNPKGDNPSTGEVTVSDDENNPKGDDKTKGDPHACELQTRIMIVPKPFTTVVNVRRHGKCYKPTGPIPYHTPTGRSSYETLGFKKAIEFIENTITSQQDLHQDIYVHESRMLNPVDTGPE